MHRQRNREDIAIDTVVYIVMILMLILMIYPFYYICIMSFNDGVDAYKGGIYFWPRMFTLENYRQLLSDSGWFNAVRISIARTLLGTVMGVLFTSVIAYALSFNHVKGRKAYFYAFVFTMYFSGGIIPFFILLKQIHLTNTFWVYVIPGMLNVYYFLIMSNFYREIPMALYESAWLDGAGDFRVFITIAMPLSKASMATIALFFAVGQWNAWMDSVYFVYREELRPLAYKMMEIINLAAATQSAEDMMSGSFVAASQTRRATTTSLQMAAMIIAVVPILAVYPFLQKYFVKGVLIGSVKG